MDKDLVTDVPSKNEIIASRMGVQVFKELPFELLEVAVVELIQFFGCERAVRLIGEAWVCDLVEWRGLVDNFFAAGCSGLSGDEVVVQMHVCMEGVLRSVVRLILEHDVEKVVTSDRQRLRELHGKSFVLRKASGHRFNCLAYSLLIVMMDSGVLDQGISSDDGAVACEGLRAELVESDEFHPRSLSGERDASAFLEHGRHADFALRYFLCFFEQHRGSVILPSAGVRLQVHARWEAELGHACDEEVLLCVGVEDGVGSSLVWHVYNSTGDGFRGLHYDALVYVAAVAERRGPVSVGQNSRGCVDLDAVVCGGGQGVVGRAVTLENHCDKGSSVIAASEGGEEVGYGTVAKAGCFQVAVSNVGLGFGVGAVSGAVSLSSASCDGRGVAIAVAASLGDGCGAADSIHGGQQVYGAQKRKSREDSVPAKRLRMLQADLREASDSGGVDSAVKNERIKRLESGVAAAEVDARMTGCLSAHTGPLAQSFQSLLKRPRKATSGAVPHEFAASDLSKLAESSGLDAASESRCDITSLQRQCPELPAKGSLPSYAAALAAEERAKAAAHRGIQDPARVARLQQSSSASRKTSEEVFGADQQIKLREQLNRSKALLASSSTMLEGGRLNSGAASASSSTHPLRKQEQRSAGGWKCSLLGRSIGRAIQPPTWHNNPACGAVGPNGTQRGLECGLFSVNHCLATKKRICLDIAQFTQRAGCGAYAEGDFDDEGLQRNLNAVGCDFEYLRGAEYQEAVRELDASGKLAIFNGEHALGCVVHLPMPRHWVALVAPLESQRSTEFAAILCDSLFSHVFALSVDEMVDLFLAMGARHMQVADSQLLTAYQKERFATDWCVYRVSQ